jgi:hypothetical protein
MSEEQNKAIVRRFFEEVWNELSILQQLGALPT